MKLALLFASLMMSFQVYASTSSADVDYYESSSTRSTGFSMYKPQDFESNPAKKYPLLFFYHGAGEAGDGKLPQLGRTTAL